MKHWMLAVALICFGSPAHAVYFENVFQNPKSAPMGTILLFTSKGSPDGAVETVSPIYHRADPNDSLVPKSWQGILPPETWGLDLGGGSDGHTGFAYFAIDWNVAPQLLSPLTKSLARAGGDYAVVGQALTQTDQSGNATGQGIRLDLGWKMNWLQDGNVPKFDQLRAPPRYGVGYAWTFR